MSKDAIWLQSHGNYPTDITFDYYTAKPVWNSESVSKNGLDPFG